MSRRRLSTFVHVLACMALRVLFFFIYRPSSDQVSQQFFKDLLRILTYLSTLSAPFIITGDINIRLDHLDDPSCRQFNDLIASFGLAQYVTQLTHDLGGILDAVVTRSY